MTAYAREALLAEPSEFDPRHFLKAERQGMREVVAQRMRQFWQAGHAGDYEPIPLGDMARRYEHAQILEHVS